MGTSHFISGTRLGLGKSPHPLHDSFGAEVEAWEYMLDNPNEAHDFWVPLRSNLSSVKEVAMVPPVEVQSITEEEYMSRVRR